MTTNAIAAFLLFPVKSLSHGHHHCFFACLGPQFSQADLEDHPLDRAAANRHSSRCLFRVLHGAPVTGANGWHNHAFGIAGPRFRDS